MGRIFFFCFRTVCIVVYITTVFFIVLYGLKFGRIKSLYWLTTILIGIFQSVVISKPFSIILTAAIIAKYFWQPKVRFFFFLVKKCIIITHTTVYVFFICIYIGCICYLYVRFDIGQVQEEEFKSFTRR